MRTPKKSVLIFLSLLLVGAFLLAPIAPMVDAADTPSASALRPQQGGGERVRSADNGMLNYAQFEPGRRIAGERDALTVIGELGAEFGLQNPQSQLRYVGRTTTFAGATVYRYEQVFNGIPVLGGELLVATNRQGFLTAVAGEVSPNLTSLNTTPTLQARAASQTAVSLVATAEGATERTLVATTPQLMIYDPILISPSAAPRGLVWLVEVKSTVGAPIDYFMLIDAKRGTLRVAFNQIDTAHGSHEAAEGHATTTPDNDGPGLPAVPNHNGTSITYNSNSTNSVNGAGSSVMICTTVQPATVNLVSPGACDNVSAPTTRERNNAAQYFALDVFNFWDFYFNRNSIDGAGMLLRSNVDYRPGTTPYNNAFWNGSWMTYGDGDFFTADDIVGHEMGHGITEFNSNLFYYYESGAINESYSDIWGETLDLLNGIDSRGNPNNPAHAWLMGEDLGIGAIRNMANPPAEGDPDRMTSPFYYAPNGENMGYMDNGGVHINSGVMNKMFYLVVDGDTFNGYTISPLAASRTDSLILASAIWYEAYNYLTSGSNYAVMRQALNTACSNLIGVGLNGTAETISAADCTEVDEASLAVEMHLPPTGLATYRPYVPLTCPNGTAPNFLFQEDFESGFGTFTTGTAIIDNLPVGSPYWGDGISFYGDPYSWSGTGSLFGTDSYRRLDQYTNLVTPVNLTGGVEYYLYFMHSWGFEDYDSAFFQANGIFDTEAYDGAVLEYTTNGGASWNDIGSLFYAGRDYNSVLSSLPVAPASSRNPLAGRAAWGYDSHGFVTSMFNLTSLAGSTVNFRWRITGDNISPKYFSVLTGWDMGYWLDDVAVYACPAAVVEIDVQDELAAAVPDGGSSNFGSTPVGSPVTKTYTVTNNGTIDLTLSTPISVPTGFTLTSSFGSTTLAPSQSTTFSVRCDAPVQGSFTGEVSFGNNDPDENPYNFTVNCTATGSTTVVAQSVGMYGCAAYRPRADFQINSLPAGNYRYVTAAYMPTYGGHIMWREWGATVVTGGSAAMRVYTWEVFDTTLIPGISYTSVPWSTFSGPPIPANQSITYFFQIWSSDYGVMIAGDSLTVPNCAAP